jgi:glycine cleavage system regulatory protein
MTTLQEDQVSDEDLVVIPLPTNKGGVSYAVARLVSEAGHAFAEAIVAIPGTTFAPPRRIALSRYSVAEIKSGAPPNRPNLYLHEGMIMPRLNVAVC